VTTTDTSATQSHFQRHRLSRWLVNPSHHMLLWVMFGALLALFWLIAWRGLDPDFGWHLQAGNYIRAHGIPAHDIFTYTARQFPWIDHEWGNDVIVSFIYGWGGYAFLALLYGALWAGALLVCGLRARISVIGIALLAVSSYAGIRPIAWTALFFAVTLRALMWQNRRAVWLLPLLFVVWANLHAGFVVGLAVIFYVAIYRRRPALFGVFALSTLATIINPYGLRLYTEVGRTLFDPTLHYQVMEWTPFSLKAASALFIVLWLSGSILFEKHTLKQLLRPSNILLLGALSATRNVPLFVIAGTGELNHMATQFVQTIPKHLSRTGRHWLTGMKLGFALITLYCAFLSFWPLHTSREATYPVAAVAYLRTNGCEGGRLLNDYAYGGYLIWQLPTQPVYIDGRMPSWRDATGQKYMTQYYALLAQPSRYSAVFPKYNMRCSLLQKTRTNIGLIRLLQHDGWTTTIQTEDYVLQMKPQ